MTDIRDRLLWTLLIGWMYGTPLLLAVGVLNHHVARLRSLAEPFDRPSPYFVAGLVLASAGPLTGIGVALLLSSTRWLGRFGIALAASFLVVFALSMLQTLADHLPAVQPRP